MIKRVVPSLGKPSAAHGGMTKDQSAMKSSLNGVLPMLDQTLKVAAASQIEGQASSPLPNCSPCSRSCWMLA